MSEVRHAILQVLWGPEAFRKVILAPGDVVRVGRADEADLVLPHDAELGKIHFEVDWDGERGEVRARHGGGETLVGGRPVVQSWLKHGAWVHAGSTDFMFYYEAETPPRKLPPDTPERRARVAEALAALSAEASLYGVFDAARDDRVLVLLREAIEEHRSLYEGTQGYALAEVAPYLVRFSPNSRLLRALVEEGWGESWGVYLVGDEPPKAVRRHLRRFLMVEEEDTGERLYFRWYDPRVIRDFMPLATVRQKSELYGNLSAWICEGPDGELVRMDRPPELSGEGANGEEPDVPRS
ncbi:DUF4123 domain-containing protein [Polyangium aurulentum]|uniref:DUF4123 domain-containing protein n=1 Tax=Polyangium aurulentum TaxID=2567896 RepID=UPI00146CB610|nr:DUF4123 domain-containing protein [Polyangium aurulentum]UQA62013.1 DUF4123 domain-containing protein [Polyangium aurulentum]